MYGNEYYGSTPYATTRPTSTGVTTIINKAIDKVVMLTKYVKNKSILFTKILRANL